jgi:hypothetical protein
MPLPVRLKLKQDFRPGEPVSYGWYNTVAEALKRVWDGDQQAAKGYPGYSSSTTANQVLMNIGGVIQWVDTEECP